MKQFSTGISFIYLFLSFAIVTTSCKKKEDPKPAPVAVNDSFDMGSDASIKLNVLANDSYGDNVGIQLTPSSL